MSTVGELVDATLNRWLYGTYRTKTNVLNGAIDASTATLDCRYAATAGEGSLLALDNELMEVTRAPQNVTTLNVIRAVRGTTAATHADGTTIEINPRYPRLSVRAAMLDELVAWPESLYRVTQITDTPVSSSGTIDVSTEIDPLSVRRVLAVWRSARCTTSDDRWFEVDWSSAKDAREPGSCDVYLNDLQATTTLTRNYRVVVGTDFVVDPFVDATDLQADVGVPRSAEDVLQLGIAYRLVTGREAKRLFTEAQGESRDATEIGSLDLARFGIQLMQLRDAGLVREADRLRGRYGVGVSGG